VKTLPKLLAEPFSRQHIACRGTPSHSESASFGVASKVTKGWEARHRRVLVESARMGLSVLLIFLTITMALCFAVNGVYARQDPAPVQSSAATAAPGIPAGQSAQSGPLIPLDEAVKLALAQASAYQQAELTERIAAEDVRQSRSAFLPKFEAPIASIFNNPILGPFAPGETSGAPTTAPSFIAANATREYLAGMGVVGDIDLAGRLRATLRRNRALLEAAHAGTEAARRALIEATEEAYYGVSLAVARRRSAEQNLSAAEQFQHITDLLFNGGEVAAVDVTRAKLQTDVRRDELEQARAAEVAATEGLRALIGSNTVPQQFSVIDLMDALPHPDEIQTFTADAISRRPELRQFEFEREAANQEIKIARSDRLPQLSYNFNAGFDTDSLVPHLLREHTGGLAQFNLTIPIFDWGIAKSRENQARLRMRIADSEREQTLRTFSQQFFTARSLAQTAMTRVDRVRVSVQDAQRNLDTSIQRYRSGEAQIIEVTDAISTLATQRAALSQAIFDYQVALSRLRQATGR
jgi:outer membrane protein TolC